MNAVRQIVDGNALASLIRLPRSLYDKKVEVIVLPVIDNSIAQVEEMKADLPQISKAQMDGLRAKSTATKLTGSIPRPYVTIQEIREERLID
jgi:hypothetical protein